MMKLFWLASVVLLTGHCPTPVQAQPFPSRPLRLLIGAAPGGGLDANARAIHEKLAVALGQPVVIDNRPGAAGSVAGEMLAKAPPDGYTLNLGSIGGFAVNYSLYKNTGYHPLKDLAPITMMAEAANVLVLHPAVPANTVKELIAMARAQPRRITYGSGGAGNAPHLAAALLEHMAGIELVHVPYKGAAPAMLDVMGGRVAMIFTAPPAAVPHLKGGRLKAMAVTTLKRSVFLPELPTMAEAGVPGYEVNNWYAMAATAGTPAATVARLNRELVAINAMPDVRQALANQGLEAASSTPDALARHMKREFDKWSTLIVKSKITTE